MQPVQRGLAIAALALHLQQDYLAVTGQKCPRNEQFLEKDNRHGRH
jgi:hypothetical protein